MELESLAEALGSADLSERTSALRQAVMRAILADSHEVARALTLYRRALIVAGAPLLDRVLGRPNALRALSPLSPSLTQGVVIWGHVEGVHHALTHQDRVITVGASGVVCQWDARGLLLAERTWPQAPKVVAGESCILVACGDQLWRWQAPAAPTLLVSCPSSIKHLLFFNGRVILSLDDDRLWCWELASQQLTPLNVAGGELASRQGSLICLAPSGALSWGDLAGEARQEAPSPIDTYCSWERYASLREDGLVVLEYVEEDPGGLYGPQTSWYLLDVLTGQRQRCTEEETRLAPTLTDGRSIYSFADGTLRILEQAPKLAACRVAPPRFACSSTRLLIAADRKLTTLDAADGATLHAARLSHPELKALMVTPTGSLTMSRYHSSHRHTASTLVHDERGEVVFTLPDGEGYMSWVDASPDGQLLLSRSRDRLTAFTPSGELVWSSTNPWQYSQRSAWSPSGQELAILTHGSGLLRVSVDGSSHTILSVNQLDSAQLACSPCGTRGLLFSEHRELLLFDVASGARVATLPRHGLHGVTDVALGDDYGVLVDVLGNVVIVSLGALRSALHKGRGELRKVALRQDRALVVGRAGRAQVWDLSAGALIHTLERPEGRAAIDLFACAWLNDEQVVTADEQGLIQLWSAKTGEPLRALNAHEGAVNTLATLPDGRLISGGSDGRVLLWTDWESPQALEAGCGAVISLSVADTGEVLISGGERKQLWTSSTGALRELTGGLYQAILSPDGRSVVAKAQLTQLEVRAASDGALVASTGWSWLGVWSEQLWLLGASAALIQWRDGLSAITIPEGRVIWRHDEAPDHVALSMGRDVAWIARGSAVYSLDLRDGALTLREDHGSKINHMATDDAGRLLYVSEAGVATLLGVDGARLGVWGHPLALTQAALHEHRALVADEAGWCGVLMFEG